MQNMRKLLPDNYFIAISFFTSLQFDQLILDMKKAAYS